KSLPAVTCPAGRPMKIPLRAGVPSRQDRPGLGLPPAGLVMRSSGQSWSRLLGRSPDRHSGVAGLRGIPEQQPGGVSTPTITLLSAAGVGVLRTGLGDRILVRAAGGCLTGSIQGGSRQRRWARIRAGRDAGLADVMG